MNLYAFLVEKHKYTNTTFIEFLILKYAVAFSGKYDYFLATGFKMFLLQLVLFCLFLPFLF